MQHLALVPFDPRTVYATSNLTNCCEAGCDLELVNVIALSQPYHPN